TARTGKARRDRPTVLFDADAAVASDEILRTDTLAHGVKQDAMQLAAVNGNMRPPMAGRLAPRLAINELTLPGEEGVVLRQAGHRHQRAFKAERAEFLHRVWTDIDADAEGADIRRRLEDPDLAVRRRCMDRQRQRQAANTAANNQDVHVQSRYCLRSKYTAARLSSDVPIM